MQALSPLIKLERLDVANTGCRRSGLAALAQMHRLSNIDLSDNPVAAADLVQLRPIAGSLTDVYARGTNVGPGDVPALKRAFPKANFWIER